MNKKFTLPPDKSLVEALKLGPSATSPKVSLQIISELQDKLRENELKLAAMSKKISHLEQENNDLLILATDKDKELQKLSEELLNMRRSSKLKQTNDLFLKVGQNKIGKSSNLHKMRSYYLEKSNKIESEVRTFKAIFEEEKKVVENKLKIYSEREIDFINKIKSLEQLIQRLELQVHDLQLQENSKKIEKVEEENQDLKKQLEIIRKAHNLHDLAMLSPDIHQISYQVSQLLAILQTLRSGKDVSLKILLSTDETSPINSSKQLISDVSELKKNLSSIKQIVSDYHAEHLGFSMCITQ